MKKRTMAFVIAAMILGLLPSVSYGQKAESGAQNITTTVNTARYILFGGTYTVDAAKNGDNRESAVFKLDTYTGKVWMLKVDKTANGRAAQWVPVEEPDSISADTGKDATKNDGGQKNSLKALKTLDE